MLQLLCLVGCSVEGNWGLNQEKNGEKIFGTFIKGMLFLQKL